VAVSTFVSEADVVYTTPGETMSNCEVRPLVLPKSMIGRWIAGLRAFRKLIADPADPLHGPIFQLCVEHSLLRKTTRRLGRHAEGRRLLAERPRLNASTVSLATLAAHPPRSLAHTYAAYFEANKIIPFDPALLPVESDHDYLATRLREVHDVLHVVTGYGTDDLGELELQWFNLGNLGWGPLPIIVLLAFVFMGRMKKYGGVWRVCKRAYAAYRRGRRSRTLASMFWEDFWHMPVGDVRALLCAPVDVEPVVLA
jgi:ubiquinone biosynthesis protein COQ4